MIKHPIPPLFDEKSKILILGSFPSAKSREQMFFYGHPQNRIIFDSADIRQIFVNGKTAEKYFNKYISKELGRKAICLPSASPANVAWSVEKLVNK